MYIFLKGGATALYIASQEGHLPALWLLMDTGAAIEAKVGQTKNSKMTPCEFVCMFAKNT